MRNIDGQTAVYGIIGNPIGHTLSPVIHNTISEEMGINAVYVPFRANDDITAMAKGLFSLGVKGINVTVPYKTDIIGELCGLDPLAKEIGAVNTLKYTKDGYYGYNTDISGLDRELEDEDIDLKGKDTVILGAGGAARAISVECALAGAEQITIINRNLQRGEELVGLINSKTKARAEFLPWADGVAIPEKTDILANATSVGLFPNTDCKPEICYDTVTDRMVVTDVIFNDPNSLFLREAKARGAKTVNGLGMLVEQGALNFKLWTGVDAPVELMTEVLRKEFNL